MPVDGCLYLDPALCVLRANAGDYDLQPNNIQPCCKARCVGYCMMYFSLNHVRHLRTQSFGHCFILMQTSIKNQGLFIFEDLLFAALDCQYRNVQSCTSTFLDGFVSGARCSRWHRARLWSVHGCWTIDCVECSNQAPCYYDCLLCLVCSGAFISNQLELNCTVVCFELCWTYFTCVL